MAMIANDWEPALKAEFAKPYYRELYTKVKEENISFDSLNVEEQELLKQFRRIINNLFII